MRAVGTIVVLAMLGVLVRPSVALARQTGSGAPAQTAAPKPADRAALDDEKRGPLTMVGWTYSSIARNGATVNINLMRGKNVPGEDAAAWRGLQLTGTVGRRAVEVGLGYARMTIAQIPFGYEFRALAGRRWTASTELSPAHTYAGGEATVMFTVLRLTAGLVAPIDPGQSHKPVLTGSVGVMFFLSGWTQKERAGSRARRMPPGKK